MALLRPLVSPSLLLAALPAAPPRTLARRQLLLRPQAQHSEPRVLSLPSRNVGRPQLHENLHLVRRQLRLLRLHHLQARHDQQPRELRKLFGQLYRKRSVSVLQPPERKPQLHARLFLTRPQQQFLYEPEQQTQLFDPQPLPWRRIFILVTGTQLWRKHGRRFCDTKRRRRKLQPRPQVETIKRDSG